MDELSELFDEKVMASLNEPIAPYTGTWPSYRIIRREQEDKRARILASYFGVISPMELAHRYNPLPFGLRSGKYGPDA